VAAVVGEQVTFNVYEYVDTALRSDLGPSDAHEPTTVDFAKHSLLRGDQEPPTLGYASIAGGTWKVRLAHRWALFPLHAGDLTIGPMQIGLARPQALAGAQRTSEALVVHVTEPPAAGRPPGYAVGDVGHFALAVQVSPPERRVDEGGAIAVRVELSGTGNVPSTVATPVREGVEWLAPETHEEPIPTTHDAFGVKRSFDYVVRVRRAGQVDLGELTLPFWNPDQKQYEMARALLGSVQVAKAIAPRNASACPHPGSCWRARHRRGCTSTTRPSSGLPASARGHWHSAWPWRAEQRADGRPVRGEGGGPRRPRI
jgi:hypothetical protein